MSHGPRSFSQTLCYAQGRSAHSKNQSSTPAVLACGIYSLGLAKALTRDTN